MSKGHKPRPLSVSRKEYNANYDNTFKPKPKKETKKVLVCQTNKHTFDIDELDFDEKLIGGIGPCPVEIEINGVKTKCGGKVIWKRGK